MKDHKPSFTQAKHVACAAVFLIAAGCESKIGDRTYAALVSDSSPEEAALVSEVADAFTANTIPICKEGEPTFRPGGPHGAVSDCLAPSIVQGWKERGISVEEGQQNILRKLDAKMRSKGYRLQDALGVLNYNAPRIEAALERSAEEERPMHVPEIHVAAEAQAADSATADAAVYDGNAAAETVADSDGEASDPVEAAQGAGALAEITTKLRRLGLCMSCADNAAQYYINYPESECGERTSYALRGDDKALYQLRDLETCTDYYEQHPAG